MQIQDDMVCLLRSNPEERSILFELVDNNWEPIRLGPFLIDLQRSSEQVLQLVGWHPASGIKNDNHAESAPPRCLYKSTESGP